MSSAQLEHSLKLDIKAAPGCFSPTDGTSLTRLVK
jgi:hypothetical protein